VTRKLVPLLAATAIAGLGPGSGVSASGPAPWATVNVCDSPSAPHQVGIRAGIPGDGSGGSVYARFTVEWSSHERHAWLPVEGRPTSAWIYAGSARDALRQAGYTFEFDTPLAGSGYVVRGRVELQWRTGGRVVRRATRVTSGGLGGVDFGDPPGLSRAACTLR
jgi:hypothetical protein